MWALRSEATALPYPAGQTLPAALPTTITTTTTVKYYVR